MKLLLTSNGFSNQKIVDTLFELVGKKPEETSLVFIPTASNMEMDEKDWFINDLINIQKQNFKSITITDISAVPEKIWRPQIEQADVLFFEGGNAYHLMRWMRESGLVKLLPELLKTKVYVGLSAGSMVAGPNLDYKCSTIIYGEEAEAETMVSLGLVDFYFIPHLNSPYYPLRIRENLEQAIKEIPIKTYAVDDQSAIKIVDGYIESVGDGVVEFN